MQKNNKKDEICCFLKDRLTNRQHSPWNCVAMAKRKESVKHCTSIPHSVYKHVKQQLAPHAKQITDQPKLFLFSSLQIQAVTFCLWAPATILPNQADHFYPSCTSSIQAGVSSCCRGKSWMLRPWTLGVLPKYSLIKMTVNVHRHLSPCFRLRRMHIC